MKTISSGRFYWEDPNNGESAGIPEGPRPHQDQNQENPAAAAVPREFPGLVYDALRPHPEAFEAVAKAIKEFYDKRVPR